MNVVGVIFRHVTHRFRGREFREGRDWQAATFLPGSLFRNPCAALAAVTVFSPHWIELTLRADPDGGKGSAEWLLAGTWALVTLISSILA